jgi:hypothetical protein
VTTRVQPRHVMLIVVLVFVVAFAGLTVVAAIEGGPDVLTLMSLVVLAMLGFGIIGALKEPPEE